jgi:hypothetical protein
VSLRLQAAGRGQALGADAAEASLAVTEIRLDHDGFG